MANKNLCSIADCGNKAVARGWCSKHWARWRKHGDPHKGGLNPLGDKCSVPGCERKPHSRWKGRKPVCNMHWLRLYNTGSTDLRDKVFASWAVCSVPGCDKDARASGGTLCEMHYWRLRRAGTLEARRPERAATKTSHGYVLVSAPGHPVCQKNGVAYLHRKVLFDQIGGGVHECHWCGREVEWFATGRRKLVVDHLDGCKTNNVISNLVPACNRCNSARGLFQSWVMEHRDDPFLWALYQEVKAA